MHHPKHLRIVSQAFLVLLFTACYTFTARAQHCNCRGILNEVMQVTEENYIGYHLPVSEKASSRYTKIKKQLLRKSQKSTQCLAFVNEYMNQFRDHHILVQDYSDTTAENNYPLLQKEFHSSADKLEGYWSDERSMHLIRIVRVKRGSYTGVVVKTDRKNWQPGDVKLKVRKSKQGKFTVYFKMSDKSAFIAPLYLKTDQFNLGYYQTWRRFTGNPDTLQLRGKSIMEMLSPSIAVTDPDMIVIRIPSSAPVFVKMVDSLVHANSYALSATKTLVVDIRNNTGGTTNVFKSLLPYINTGRFVTEPGTSLVSPEIIRQDRIFLSRIKDTGSASYRRILKSIHEMETADGKLLEGKPDTLRFEQVMPFPQQVAILSNERCVSAAELFLLMARQSEKVKVFGVNTHGAVDRVGIYDHQLKCANYMITLPAQTLARSIQNPVNPSGRRMASLCKKILFATITEKH